MFEKSSIRYDMPELLKIQEKWCETNGIGDEMDSLLSFLKKRPVTLLSLLKDFWHFASYISIDRYAEDLLY